MATAEPLVSPLPTASLARVRALAVVRELAIGGLASLVAGVIVVGLGSRLFMRIAALLDPGAAGAVTGNGNVIGQITLEGSLALLVFVGIFSGIAGGIFWAIVSPWLPSAGAFRLVGAALVALALGLRTGVEGDPEDFAIVSPAWTSVAMLVILAAAFGVAVALLDGWLRRRLPAADRSVATAVAYVGLGTVGLLFVPPLLLTFFAFESMFVPVKVAWVGVAVVVTGLATLAWWLIRIRTGATRPPRPLSLLGRGSVAVVVVAGLANVGWMVAGILDLR